MDYEINGKKYSAQQLQDKIDNILKKFLTKIEETSPNLKKTEEKSRSAKLSDTDEQIYQNMKNKNDNYYNAKINRLQTFDEEQDVNEFLKEFFDLHKKFEELLNKIKRFLNSNKDSNLNVLVVDNSFKHMTIYINKLIDVNQHLLCDRQDDKIK